jgi:hypothetical protein
MRPLAFTALYAAVVIVGCSGSDNTVQGSAGCVANPQTFIGTASFKPSATCPQMCAPTNADYCAQSGITNTCPAGNGIDNCGVPLKSLPKLGDAVPELKRSSTVMEFAGSGKAELGCFTAGNAKFPKPPGMPQTIKLKGVAKIFSHGEQSNNLQIEIHKVVRSGGADDGNPGELVGAVVTTAADCMNTGVTKIDKKGDVVAHLCTFEYPGVPTETELLIKTGGNGWATLYEYGLYVTNSEVQNGESGKDVRALSADDYQLIPQVAIGHTIGSGHGALAGEVHDCDNVRLGGAVVDIDKARVGLAYFSDDEAAPLPLLANKSTSVLGLYSAFDVAPGPVAVAAAGVLDGKLVSVGYFKARVFPDAVSTFTFRGLRPYQLKK